MTTYLKPHHKIHRNKESQSNHKRRFGFNFPISAHQKKNQRHFCRRKTFFEYFSCFVGHKMWLFIGFWVHLWFKWRIKVCIVIGSKWVILEGLPVFFCVHLLGRAYGFSSHFSWTFFSTVITKVQMRQGEPNLKKRQTFDKNMLLHQQQRIRVTHKQWICVYSCCLI